MHGCVSAHRGGELAPLRLLGRAFVATSRATSGTWSTGRGSFVHMAILRRIASSPRSAHSTRSRSRRWSDDLISSLSLRSWLALDGETLRIRSAYGDSTAFGSLLRGTQLYNSGRSLSSILAIAFAKCRGRAVPDDLECWRTAGRVQVLWRTC
jgi:hypothetical protein